MDEQQEKYIRIRKQSGGLSAEKLEELKSEEPFEVAWIREEYELVKNYIPAERYVESFAVVVNRMLKELLRNEDLQEVLLVAQDITVKRLINGIRQNFLTGTISIYENNSTKKHKVTERNFDEFLRQIAEKDYFYEGMVCGWCRENSYFRAFLKGLARADQRFELVTRNLKLKAYEGKIQDYINRAKFHVEKNIEQSIDEYFTQERVLTILKNNKNHPLYAVISEREEVRQRVRKHLLERIPDSYVDLYPDARELERHFLIHHGPTNSGKTYESVQRLKQAENGIYAGPLRLLAYEIFERLNKDAVLCSMRTGEERIDVPGYTVMASTVEMVNIDEEYDIAVVDEAQLVADPFRGGAWTRVILGVRAREIHLCCSDEAVPILKRMIEDCGDTYEEIAHTRNTPLLVDEREFTFPQSIEPHDALIVFSRKMVHAVAEDLRRAGWSCSIIYGDLPYDVRHREAEKFIRGETSVLVSTDAIGLGLNLPIRRVVFLRLKKFDGVEIRPLNAAEVKQIGGRAGRFGIYDKGYVTAEGDPEFIRERINTPLPEITEATIQFPETIIDIDAPMLDILTRWKDVTVNTGYRKADIEREIKLCKLLMPYIEDKYFIYRAVTIPFDERENELLEMWFELALSEQEHETMVPEILRRRQWLGNKRLDALERSYHACDLLYNFASKFDHAEYTEDILELKKLLSDEIIYRLSVMNREKKKKKKPREADREENR